jgi:hypothetical protein
MERADCVRPDGAALAVNKSSAQTRAGLVRDHPRKCLIGFVFLWPG